MSGRIQIGAGPFGSTTTWRLHQPGVGPRHGLVTGPPGSGRTTALTCMLINALHSRRCVIMPTAQSWDSRQRSTWQTASPYASEGATQASHLFRMLDRLITTRLEAGGYQDPTFERPAVLVTIDDSEQLLSDRRIRTVAERLVGEGSAAGIGLIAVTAGEGIEHFGHNERLRTALMAGSRLTFVGTGSPQ